ncbi:TetR/AcrR family transcriptional regulator [Herbaspirillum robiniae]|uniref:TetR/AcrR family transcriptional regulator n=1 Tax=Herbaspirillum robiniae TaxID=2014887 RepID=UPI003D783EEA
MPSGKNASPWKKIQDRDAEREVKREAVLRTAAQLFNEKGFHATSLDEVAERLNVSKPTLYYYVKNKDEILFECVRIGLEKVQRSASEAGASNGAAIDKLIAAMRAYAEIVTMDFGMCLIRVGEDPLPAESRKKLRALKAKIDNEFRSMIKQGIAEGSIVKCDPKVTAFLLAGALSWIGRWYQEEGGLTPIEIADQAVSLILDGLRERGSSARRVRERASAVRTAA